MDTCLYVPGAGGVNGGVMPPKCLPSPRCVARVHASNRQGTPFSMRKYLGGGESVERHRRQSIPIDEDADATPRSYPISHPPRDPPLCQDCRYFDARLSPCDVDADDVCCSTDFSHIRLTNGVHLDSPSEDDVLRAMLTNGCLRGAWWCDRCVALLSMPEIEVGHLFALLRQWTPCTQLQLDTIVMEMFKRGTHVDDRDGLTGMTLLHYTAKSGALGNEDLAFRICEYLLDQGACLEARSGLEDMTALHYAAYFDCPRLAELLVMRGADPLARCAVADGATPLHLAAAQLSLGTARLLAHLPLMVKTTAANGDALVSPITCKEALDLNMRTPYEYLPPVGDLPEPLSGMRDRLAELLAPPLDDATKQQLFSLGAGCGSGDYRSLVSTTLTSASGGYLSPALNRVRTFGSASSPSSSPRISSAGHLHHRQRSGVQHWAASHYDTPPSPANYEPVAPMPAETGVLTPRRSRKLEPAGTGLTPTKTADPTHLDFKSKHPVSSSSPPPQQINHPLPPTASVSAKVTLHAMGLTLGDRVCVGPGGTGSVKGTNSSTGGRMGRLRYCGPVDFASGCWVGVELDDAFGKNDGSVGGVHYFVCSEKHGIFAPIGRVYKVSRTGSGVPIRPGTPLDTDYESRSRRSSSSTKPIDVTRVAAKVDTGLHRQNPSKKNHVVVEDVYMGDTVLVAGLRRGIVRYIGETVFAPGVWYGVELSTPVGKNDGSVEGIRYFSCKPKHGVFAPVLRLQKVPMKRSPTGTIAPCMSQSLHEWTGINEKPRWSNNSDKDSSNVLPSVHYASLGRPSTTKNRKKGLGGTPSDTPRSVRRMAEEKEFFLQEGMQVLCIGELGQLRYMGPVDFTEGVWLGIELRHPRGRHDGMVAGKRFFTCPPGHGILVRPSRVTFRGINAANLLPPSLQKMEKDAGRGGTDSVCSKPTSI